MRPNLELDMSPDDCEQCGGYGEVIYSKGYELNLVIESNKGMFKFEFTNADGNHHFKCLKCSGTGKIDIQLELDIPLKIEAVDTARILGIPKEFLTGDGQDLTEQQISCLERSIRTYKRDLIQELKEERNGN